MLFFIVHIHVYILGYADFEILGNFDYCHPDLGAEKYSKTELLKAFFYILTPFLRYKRFSLNSAKITILSRKMNFIAQKRSQNIKKKLQ